MRAYDATMHKHKQKRKQIVKKAKASKQASKKQNVLHDSHERKQRCVKKLDLLCILLPHLIFDGTNDVQFNELEFCQILKIEF